MLEIVKFPYFMNWVTLLQIIWYHVSRHLIYIVLVLSLGKLFSCPKCACMGQPSVWRDFTSSPASVLYTLFFNLIPHRCCIHWFTFLNQTITGYIWLTCILIVYWMGDSCCPCSYLHPFIYCNISDPLSISFMLCFHHSLPEWSKHRCF